MILLRILAGLALAQAALIGFALAQPNTVAGVILYVIDGDTFRIRHEGAPQGEAVRARHFNTAEKGDLAECQEEAAIARQGAVLARRLLPKGSVVRLSDLGRDRYGRLLATITLADGRDLAALMTGAGVAVPYEGGRRQSWCVPFRRRRHDGLKKGLSAPRTVKGKCRAAPVIGGRDAPKIRRRIASRPPGFGSDPARPPTLDRAHPDFTTRKRCAGQWGIGSQGAPDGKESSMARQYHSLLLLDQGQWRLEFGDYDRETVTAERDDYHQGGGYPLRDLRIITTRDSQAAIDAAVAKLNGEG